jgi:hypothetical protein
VRGAIVVVNERLHDPRIVAVALSRISRHASAKKVHLVITRQVLDRIDVPRGQQSEPALLCAEAVLVLVVEGRVGKRKRAKAGVPNVGDLVALAPDAPGLDKASEGNLYTGSWPRSLRWGRLRVFGRY